jgi:drug/metabolite transporter (DMT)-like permease
VLSILYIFLNSLTSSTYFSDFLSSLDFLTIFLLFLVAFFDLAVNWLIFKTFQLEKAGIVASVNFLCVVWSVTIDVSLLGYEFKSWMEIVGGVIVMISTSVIVFNS